MVRDDAAFSEFLASRFRESKILVVVQRVQGDVEAGELPKRTEALHGLLDVAVGLN
jgi:hypothetical protein